MRTGRVQINKPIFKGGNPEIGVAEYRLKGLDFVEVEILYTRKSDGKKSWPYIYKMAVEKLMTYPQQIVAAGVKLRVAPMRDFDVV